VEYADVTLQSVTTEGKEAEVFTASTDEEGIYNFHGITPGRYSVRAKKSGKAALTMAWEKTEVVLSPGEKAREGLKLVPWEGVVYLSQSEESKGFGTLTGKVLHRGKPLAGVIVTLYFDRSRGLRGPGFRRSFPTDEEGAFELAAVETGSYFVTARKRAAGSTGPVRQGDLFGEFNSPIEVRDQTKTVMTLHVVEKMELRPPQIKGVVQTNTILRGRIIDEAGEPMAGLYVFAYRDRIVGHKMPDFLSNTTSESGLFLLPLGKGGLFYLGARQHFGGSPEVGELFGLYEGSADHGIRVKEGELITDMVISVHEVLEEMLEEVPKEVPEE
jgi:uncharacterized GH25 family protein